FYFRRRAPFAVLMITSAFVTVLLVNDYPGNFQTQTMLIAAYSVGSYCNGRKQAIGASTVGLCLVICGLVGIPDANNANLALTGAIYAAAFAVGSSMRNRRLYEQQLEQRAVDLEHERDEEAKRAVADERLHIAQELHDVVAHSMGVIAVQAGVGAHVID